MPLPKQEHEYTYADYLKWDKDERIEILDGYIYMHAAPSTMHQSVSSELHIQIGAFLRGKPCKVFSAPFCVNLDDKNVVEPDITVVCDKYKLDDKGCIGSPDMIVEIISPSSVKMDRVIKFNKYESAGVKEYWIVEPNYKVLSVFKLQENNRYGRAETYTDEDVVKVSIFPDLEIDLKSVFDF